ncbi:hypothetical protein MPDQ_000391 [Monascus purpureus]|uniref:Altered inheritance of mitochondria protein 9, mitochondrial n=1 Tax=Monascus purpureus TaxID=5098 RepID=A0A507QPY9_MONPU|nr:hypothetical protein MPDQ_000391 [Monascus purpureus]
MIASRRISPARTISKSTLKRTLAIYCQGSLGAMLYSNGRFLVNEEYELAKRYARFDIDALCKVVSSLPSVGSPIIKIDKKEGGYNKALLMKAENGITVSERFHSEYIVLDKSTGRQLPGVWNNLNKVDRFKLVGNFARLESKLASIRFPAYGALYLREHLPPRLKQPGRTIDVDDTYCLGPVYHGSWPGGYAANPEEYERFAGPWRTLFDLGHDAARQGIWQIENHKSSHSGRGPHFGDPEEHVRLLKTAIDLIRILCGSPMLQKHSNPALSHPDFHPGNIFVSDDDPTRISGVIDWQFTTVMPRFTQVRWPVFLNTPEGYQTNRETPELPLTYEEEDELDKKRKCDDEEKLGQYAMTKCYESALLKSHLESYLALTEIDVAVRQLFISCAYTYRDGIIPLRDCLVKIFQNWSKFDVSADCPYHFSRDEIAQHERQFKDYGVWLQMRKHTHELLGSNDSGWVPPRVNFEEAQKKHEQLYENFIKAKTKHMSEREAGKLWFFRERG